MPIFSRSIQPLAISLTLWALPACDSSAHSPEPSAVPQILDGESLAYESCAASFDCKDALRCIQGKCLDDNRSRLGDFHAAAGRRALGVGDFEQAARDYNSAVTQYESEKRSPPMDLLCEQGVAMAQGRSDAKLAEAAARILHKCILAVPASSDLSLRALDALASLSDVGLDAKLLARNETADLYLTGQAKQVDLSTLNFQVTVEGKANKKRSFATLLEALGSADSRRSFGECWQSYNKSSRKEELSVVVPFEYRFILDEDDESRDRAILGIGKGSAGSPSDRNLATANQCVEDVASKVASETVKGMRDDTRWKSQVRIRVAK